MKLTHRLSALLLTLALLFGALTACGAPGDAVNTTTAATNATTTAVTEPAAPAATEFALVADGEMQYDIIRHEELDSSAVEIVHARNIMTQVKTLTGASSSLGTDWVKRGAEPDAEKKEILIGVTTHPETQQVIESLAYGDWAIRPVGNKIVIFGFDSASLSYAVSVFNRTLSENVSEDGKSITLTVEQLTQTGTKNEQLSALPHFAGGTYYAYYEGGNSCDELIYRETDAAQYRAYLTALEGAGFVKYVENEIAGNLFATLNSAKYTVNIGYYAYENAVRILIEPLAPAVGLKEENQYTPVTTTQLTMLGQQYTASDGTVKANGQSILIRCADGRFIIVDGGHNRADIADELLQTMRLQSADYAKSMKDITVAAWIVTHIHGDHCGMLMSQYNVFRGITVERVLVNYLSETERLKAVHSELYGKNWSETEGSGYGKVTTAAKALGAELHQIHVGQVYYIADVTMEVLYTIESFAPQVCNALNTSSTVMKMDIAGTTYMSTGDATGNGMEICADMFGEYMQSDIVQVCHHGASSWGNDAGIIKAYTIINAPTVLWPRGESGYESAKAAARNAILYKVPNYKEDYVSGMIGDTVVLPMPYTVGSGVISRVAK